MAGKVDSAPQKLSSPTSVDNPQRNDIIQQDWDIGDSDDESGILDQIKIPDNPLVPSHLNSCNGRETLLLFGAKRFLIHHDYILFPYCVHNKDYLFLERPVDTRVSEIVQTVENERYLDISNNLEKLAKLLDVDTSQKTELTTLKRQIEKCRRSKLFDTLPDNYKEFINGVRKVLIARKENRDQVSNYRSACSSFLKMVLGSHNNYLVQENPGEGRTTSVTLHRRNVEVKVSTSPDIIITKLPDDFVEYNVLVVQCKKYRDMTLHCNVPVLPSDETEIKKLKPKVKFAGHSTPQGTACAPILSAPSSNTYMDLDGNICRRLTYEEKKYFGFFIAQTVLEILGWFDGSCTDQKLKGLLPPGSVEGKTVRYGIGVVGFKMVFMTVGMNSSYCASSPHITVGQRSLMGLEIFMTRPFDMMNAADRKIIKDIIFALTS